LPAERGSRNDPQVARIPDYYRDFLAQADDVVRKHLHDVGEPEIAQVTATDPVARSEQITQAFQAAAHRYRHDSPAPADGDRIGP
jgi:hypothetical protein